MIVTGKAVVDWVAQRTNEFGHFGTETGIGWAKAGQLVAGVAYANWNGPNIECHIASDRSKRWLTRQYLWAIFDYPFNQAKCDRITVCIGQGNADSIRFVKHLGFELECELKDAHPTGALCIYRLFREECRWIKGYTCEQKRAA